MNNPFNFGLAALAIFFLGLVIIRAESGADSAPLTPTETVLRYERTINGARGQCERREDHVRGTTETSC